MAESIGIAPMYPFRGSLGLANRHIAALSAFREMELNPGNDPGLRVYGTRVMPLDQLS